MDRFLLPRNATALLVIDIQDKLVAAMDPEEAQKAIEATCRMVKGFEILGCPVWITEQYPRGLGPTVPSLQEYASRLGTLEKLGFSCCSDLPLTAGLREKGIRSVVLAGMETHVCVLQTALDLLLEGFHVHVAADAVLSRHAGNRLAGLEFIRQAGGTITTSEIALFQLTGRAGTPEFKEISRLVR